MSDSIAYFNGKYIPRDQVQISPDDRGFLFGDGIYEVIRSYNGKLFRFDDHLRRMRYGANEINLEFDSFETLNEVANILIDQNGLRKSEAIVYIQITRGNAPRTHFFPPKETPCTVYVYASEFQPDPNKQTSGIAVALITDLRWKRCDIKTINLLPNVLARQCAQEQQRGEAIFIREGQIVEGSHTNVFAVKNETLLTHEASFKILSGITRGVVIELAQDLSIPIKFEAIKVDSLPDIEEMFVTGTTTEITPVTNCDGIIIGRGNLGPVTAKLQKAFKLLVNQL